VDPDAALAEAREIIRELKAETATPEDLDRLAELTDAIDQWLAAGGFLPHRWATAGGLSQGMRYFITWTGEDEDVEIVATGTRDDLHDLITEMQAGQQCWSANMLVEKLG